MKSQSNMKVTTWERIVRDFLRDKREAEEEKYLKNTLKNIAVNYETVQWLNDEAIKRFFDTKKNKDQTLIEFQRQKFATVRLISKQPSDLNWEEINSAYNKKCIELSKKFSPIQWIDNAAPKASSVSFASHVAKLTHSKIDSSSILDQINVKKMDALTTSSLDEPLIDGAINGNQYAPIFQFLELQSEGKNLAHELSQDHSVALKPFARNDEQLKDWNQAFKKVSGSSKLATHALLKQIYFPLDNKTNDSYHLLSHLTSSSLAHAIVQRLFNEEKKQVEKQYKQQKYCQINKVDYPRRAKISVTASNHSNASKLNGKRGGKLHLLSTPPPVWRRQLTPPISRKSWFDYGIPHYAVKDDIQYLCDFLLRFDRLELSTRDPKRRKWLKKWGNQIADEVLFHAGTIQVLPPGWSNSPGIKLKPEQQCFLDPYRDDTEFQAIRTAIDWQPVICQDFANWLNRQLKGKDKKFTPQAEHTKLWVDLMEPQLRELEQTFKTAMANKKESI